MTATSFPKHKINVLLLEGIHRRAEELFRSDGLRVEMLPGSLSEDELIERLPDVHLLGIRSKTRLTPRALDAGRRLIAIGCFCIGTNQVHLGHCRSLGLPVYNSPFSNTRSVAELVICEIVALSRGLADRSKEMHGGTWSKRSAGSFEVRGKTVGIVGYGRIGRQVGVLAEAMGLSVLFYDVVQQLPMGNNKSLGSLEAVLEASDFVTLHVPETPDTRGMIGRQQLAHMKQGAYLLNLSRGNVVDLEALADALKDRLAGAAVDVFPEEPKNNGPGFVSPLRGLQNVILTPHVGGSTVEAQKSIGREVATALLGFLNVGTTTGAVNFPEVDVRAQDGAHRILNVHRNVPGVLSNINKIVSDVSANVERQVLATDPELGYLVMDVDRDVSDQVRSQVAALETSIKTRILY